VTFIAIAAARHRADILTDTFAYSGDHSLITRTTKVTLVSHLDAAVTFAGGEDFRGYVEMLLIPLYVAAEGFDELVAMLPDNLRSVWERTVEVRERQAADTDTDLDTSDSLVHLVGWSPSERTFQSWAFGSRFGFTADRLHGLYVNPAPWSCPPSVYESDEFLTLLDPADTAPGTTFASWLGRPAPAIPPNPKAWVQMAMRSRQDRGLADIRTGVKRSIGGDLHHTHLEVGKATVRKVHTFNDTGDEFARLVAGTEHPIALASPCLCGSGAPFEGCCYVATDRPMPSAGPPRAVD